MKRIIKTPKAPLPIGPYNQAVIANNTLYISGQVAIDPTTNEVVTGEIEVETRQVMENLKAILEEAGLTFENVLKSSVFVKDMHLFSRINAVYAAYFKEASAPARELVEVVNLPKFVNIEISMIATMG